MEPGTLMRQACALLLLLLAAFPRAAAAQSTAELLPRMTLEEKFWQLFMVPGSPTDSGHDYRLGIFGLQIPAAPTARQDAARIDSVQRFFVERTRLGIPIIPFDEAVHGLTRPGATVFPQAIGLAATWDTALMGRVATAIARETRSRGIRQVLSPVVNLATDVRWGRTEETYGEDPLLASAMAAAYVSPFERLGVITTPKHFVANVGEGGRDSYPIALDDRTLAELYYPPFCAALAALSSSGPAERFNSVKRLWVMTASNAPVSTYCTITSTGPPATPTWPITPWSFNFRSTSVAPPGAMMSSNFACSGSCRKRI